MYIVLYNIAIELGEVSLQEVLRRVGPTIPYPPLDVRDFVTAHL